MNMFRTLAAIGAFSLTFAVPAAAQDAEHMPLSDPGNSGGWVLNELVSDEFEAEELDRDKWIVQGHDGRYHTWRGRAPSQFAGQNVFVNDGMMVLRSQWEPDFDFHDSENGGARYGDPIAPVTAAAVISRHRFLNGYMEVRSRASSSAMTSSFWTLGYQSELDMYEQMGRPHRDDGSIEADTLNSAIHDWRPGRYTEGFGQNKTFHNRHELGFNVADDFHIYGTEWDENYLRFYVDGELIHESSREEIGDGWVLTNPLELWFDTEIFRWLGNPTEEELPADYLIDYVRVWQKPSSDLLDRAFFGFEGPMIFPEFDRPIVGENNRGNQFSQDWYFHGEASDHFEIVENEMFYRGKRALRFTHSGEIDADTLTAFAPFGSVETSAGNYMLSARVYVPAESGGARMQFVLDRPWMVTPSFDLADLPRDEWVRLQFPITRSEGSADNDRLRLTIDGSTASGDSARVYFDEISLIQVE